jgi:signal transduction histidine kinase
MLKSIQSRLATGLIISLFSLFLILWALISFNIQEVAEDYTASRLYHDIENLLNAVNFDNNGIMSLNKERINTIYNRPFSGHYYSIHSGKTNLRSRSLWDQNLLPENIIVGKYTHKHQVGPDNQELIVVTSKFSKSDYQITIIVAEDLSSLNKNIQYFKNLFATIAAIALIILLLIQIYILRKGLQPLQEVKRELAELEQGHLTILSCNVPTELKPVTEEINHLLSILHKRLNRSRDALSDLSHAIKKPLTVLHQLIESSNSPHHKGEIKEQLQNIQKLTDRILKRARLAGNFNTGTLFNFKNDLDILFKTIQSMYPLKNIELICHISKTINMPIDREDMLELLGNLIDNAYKWANKKIIMTINETDSLHIIIEDDGPGCELDSLKQLAIRGVRLDETTSGHGFGLAICTDMVDDYSGQISFSRSAVLSGFKVDVSLPVHNI